MIHRITSVLFNSTVVLAGTALAVWLTITGHTLLIGGLLVAMAAVLAAVIFGLRLAEGSGRDRLSISVGPLTPLGEAGMLRASREAAREAA